MRQTYRFGLGALASIAFHAAAFGQPQDLPPLPGSGLSVTAPLVRAAEPAPPEEAAGEPGRMFTPDDLPAPPAWGPRALRFSAPGAAAHRLYFDRVALPGGARMFVYGLDAAGRVTTVFGPYEQAGPLPEGSFRSRVVPGVEAVVEIQGMESGPWPMRVAYVAAIDSALLSDLRMSGDPSLAETPEERKPPRGERTQIEFEGRLVTAEIIGDDIVVEGDMIVGSAKELRAPGASPHGARQRAVIRTEASGRWTGGKIPFVIDPVLAMDTRIDAALQTWITSMNGILSFVPRTAEHDFVRFSLSNSSVCSAEGIGRDSGARVINVSPVCSTGNLRHEIGHALGFHHEQNREDRDHYVRILWDNIRDGFEDQFERATGDANTDIGPYDFGSIMHYPLSAFSKNGQNTIEPRVPVPPGVVIGQRTAPSAGDVSALKSLYGAYLTPAVVNVPAAGGEFAVRVSTPPDRAWIAQDDAPWVGIISGSSGQGDGVIRFTVASNFPVASQGLAAVAGFPTPGRTANLTVGLLPFSSSATVKIIQAAPDCVYSVSPAKILAGFEPGSYTVSVTTSPACTWGATEGLSWARVSPITGQGNGTVVVTLQQNIANNGTKPGKAPKRTGTIVVAGKQITIEQEGGCGLCM